MNQLSHLDEKGQARMVDVTAKASTLHQAVARGSVRMRPGNGCPDRTDGDTQGGCARHGEDSGGHGGQEDRGTKMLLKRGHPLKGPLSREKSSPVQDVFSCRDQALNVGLTLAPGLSLPVPVVSLSLRLQ